MLVPTSSAVYYAIREAHHKDLIVVGSYSAPTGDHYGDPTKGVMSTLWGFKDSDLPIIKTTVEWDIDEENPDNRKNIKSIYWLFRPAAKEEE